MTNTAVRLCVGHQHSQFWSILARVMDNYSAFSGPKAISMVFEPQGVITSRSSTLIVLANFGMFHGLLLAILGPGVISTINEPYGCVYMPVINTHGFLSILTRFMDYYSPFWGPKAISTVVKPQGALTCRSSTLTVLFDSGPFRGLLLTVLGSRSDFHV